VEGSMNESELKDREIVDKAVKGLMVHFDAVQVFVTRHEAGSTMGYTNGEGNWYSRFGMVEEWMNKPTVSEPDEEEDS